MKSFKNPVKLLSLMVGLFLSLSFIFPSCKEILSEEIPQRETLVEEPAIEQIQERPALEQMIGEMIILGFKGTEISSSSKIVEFINKYHIGGVVLFDFDIPSNSFPRNIETPEQTRKLIKDLKELARSDLFIAIDAEGGYVNRLKEEYGFVKIESPQVMGKSDPQNTFLNASLLGIELGDLGFNLNFAPVIDVNINKNNPVIGALERSFSEDPVKVYEHAVRFIDAMNKYNIIAAVKHFPGHGSSTEDSHMGLTDITDTYYEEIELFPYAKLIEDNKTDMIMTAHIMNTDIDPDNPATLSSIFLKGILKGRLKYEGIIVSDDMQMGAITHYFGFEESIIKAINAGCNLLIYSNNNQEYEDDLAQKVVETIRNAVMEGKIDEEEIINSYNKIRKLKEEYNIN